MSRTSNPLGTVELEAFADAVAADVLDAGLIDAAIERAISELSVAFDPCWSDAKKLAWLFVANFGTGDGDAVKQELSRRRSLPPPPIAH